VCSVMVRSGCCVSLSSVGTFCAIGEQPPELPHPLRIVLRETPHCHKNREHLEDFAWLAVCNGYLSTRIPITFRRIFTTSKGELLHGRHSNTVPANTLGPVSLLLQFVGAAHTHWPATRHHAGGICGHAAELSRRRHFSTYFPDLARPSLLARGLYQ